VSKQKLKLLARKRWREKNTKAGQALFNQKDQEVVATMDGK